MTDTANPDPQSDRPAPRHAAASSAGADAVDAAAGTPAPAAHAGATPAEHPAPAPAPASAPAPANAPQPIGDQAWLRVSPKYAWVDLVGNLIPVVIAGAAAYVIPTFLKPDIPILVVIALAAIAVGFLVNAVLAFRRVRAMGYVLREDDLVFRRGIMFERIIAVPYGRLQLVDVTRGPLLRALGLANLKFVTAAAATGIALPGLVDADAEALRDELIRLAESRRSGL